MRFRLTPISMTLDDLELCKFEFAENLSRFRRFRTQQWRQASIVSDRQRCKHVELEQFLACFRVVPLGFLVFFDIETKTETLALVAVFTYFERANKLFKLLFIPYSHSPLVLIW